MKKHFLLLLMAFMSLTGWATITVGTPTTAKDLKYNGTEQVLITADGTITGGSAGTVVLYRFAESKPTFNPASSAWVTKANLKAKNAGTYKIWYVAYDEVEAEYSAVNSTAVEVKIAQKSLTAASSTGIVFTAPANATYNGAKQSFTPNVTDGGVAIDASNFTVSYKYCATATGTFEDCDNSSTDESEWVKNAQYYKQVITGTASGNYTGTLTSEAFQITPAPLLVQVKDESKLYQAGVSYTGATDDTTPGDFTLIYDGFVLEEDASNLDTKPTVTKTYTNADTYEVIATGGVSKNYEFVYVKGTLTIAQAKLKVTALPKSATVGSAEAAITSWTGKDYFSDETGHLASAQIKLNVQTGVDATTGNPIYGSDITDNDDILSYFTQTKYQVGSPAVDHYFITGIKLTRAAGTSAGKYDLTPGGATSATSNYDIVYAPGTFTIGKAKVTITLDNKSKVYGDEDPEWTWTISGAAEADKAAIEEKFSVTRVEGENAGTYDVTLTVADNTSFDNYTIDPTWKAKLIITKRPLTITANDQVLYVGDSFADLDQTAYTITGLQNEETIKVNLGFSSAVDFDTDEKLTNGGSTTGIKEYDGGITIAIEAGQDAVTKNYSWTASTDLKAGKLTVYENTAVLFLDDTDEALDNTIKEAASGATDAANTRTIRFSSRVLKAGQWNTLVLPFATSVPQISSLLNYAVVDVLAPSTDPELISLKLAFAEIPANTPFMVQPAADINLNTVNFGAKVIKYTATPEVEDGAGHKFIGTYKGYNVTSADKSEYYYSTSQKKFVNAKSSTKIGIMRAYLKDTNAAGSGARIITIEEADGSVTAIDAVEAQNGENNGAIYNLQGVRVNKAGKGVYIQNGKKYIK